MVRRRGYPRMVKLSARCEIIRTQWVHVACPNAHHVDRESTGTHHWKSPTRVQFTVLPRTFPVPFSTILIQLKPHLTPFHSGFPPGWHSDPWILLLCFLIQPSKTPPWR